MTDHQKIVQEIIPAKLRKLKLVRISGSSTASSLAAVHGASHLPTVTTMSASSMFAPLSIICD